MSNEYEIWSLVDLLELEHDQVERLCAELPSAIAHIKGLQSLVGAVAHEEGIEGPASKLLSPLTWIDDGKTDLDVVMTDPAGDKLSYEVRSNEAD